MRSTFSEIMYSTWHGIALAGVFGGAGALVVGGITALFSGPVALAAGIGAGVFGLLLGAGGAAVSAGTSHRGDYRGAWLGGIPATAALAIGIPVMFSSPIETPQKTPAPLTQPFNDVSTPPNDPPQGPAAVIRPDSAVKPSPGNGKTRP